MPIASTQGNFVPQSALILPLTMCSMAELARASRYILLRFLAYRTLDVSPYTLRRISKQALRSS